MAITAAKVQTNPGRANDFIAAVSEVANPTREEDGNLFYELYQTDADENTFYFVEEWKSDSDFQLHLAKPHVKEFESKLPGIVSGDVQPFFWKKVV